MSFAANPKAKQLHPSDAPQESTGPIASDSLAAESIKAGGEFAENENAVPLGVKGSSSTLNTTDTSGATTLHSATSGAAREREDAQGLGSDEKGVSGVKYPDAGATTSSSGDAPTETFSGASGDSFTDSTTGTSSNMDTKDSKITSSGESNMPPSSTSTGTRPYVDSAPNYAGTFRSEGELKPKGDDLTEGGIPETKTFTGDVGGQHDPGRLAERDFQKMGASDTISAGGVKDRSEPETSTGQYDVLSSERAPDTSS